MIRAPWILLAIGYLSACSPGGAGDGIPMRDAAGGDAIDLDGRIVGLDGAALGGVAVSVCSVNGCNDTVTDAVGRFAFASVPSVASHFYALRARLPSAPEYAELALPVYYDAMSSNPHLGDLLLPRVGAGAPVGAGPQSFAVDSQLTLTLDGDALTFPASASERRLAGVRIPDGMFPEFCVPSAQVLAMWAFAPTGVQSHTPIGLRLGDTLGLGAGNSISLITVDPVSGEPTQVASATVSADGSRIETAADAGVDRLSWLLVAVVLGGP